MSVSLMMAVRDDHDPRLTPSLKLTLITLASYHSERSPDRGVAPRTDRIAIDTGFSSRAIQKHLLDLERLGKIMVERPSPKRRGRLYVLVPNERRDVSQTNGGSLRNEPGFVATSQVREDKPRDIKPLTGMDRAAPDQQEEPMGWNPAVLGEEPDFDDKPKPRKKKRQTVTPGTSEWVEHVWNTHLATYCKITDWDRGMFRGALKHLQEERTHTNEQIAEAIRHWIISNARYIKSKREVDPTKLFVGAVNNGLLRKSRPFTGVNTTANSAFGADSANEKLGW